jgi:TPR repeat protein
MTINVFGENIYNNTVYVAGPFGFRKVDVDNHRLKYITYNELVECIHAYTRSEQHGDWVYTLKELETTMLRMYDLMKADEADEHVSFAFHIVARAYEKTLPKTKDPLKDALKQKIIDYYEVALQLAPNEALQADLYHNMGQFLERQEDYEHAFQIWTDCSKLADGWRAFNFLGSLYQNGLGVKEDKEKALELFREGAKHDDPHAEFNIALHLDIQRTLALTPEGKRRFKELALRQYQSISKNMNHEHSNESYLASIYLNDLTDDGQFAPQDIQKSLKSYKSAAKMDKKNYSILNLLALTTFLKEDKHLKGTTVKHYLSKADKLGSKVAKAILPTNGLALQAERFKELCANPDTIYFEN